MPVEYLIGREILAPACRTPEALADFMHRSQVVIQTTFTPERLIAERADPLKANKQTNTSDALTVKLSTKSQWVNVELIVDEILSKRSSTLDNQ